MKKSTNQRLVALGRVSAKTRSFWTGSKEEFTGSVLRYTM